MSDVKDFWDKLDILLKPTGGIVTGIAVALIGYFGSDYLKQKELLDANSRVFAQIISQREDADSTLRMNMFNSIITKFYKDPSDRGEQILSLELLAYNFHESLDLAPLFKHTNDLLRDDHKKTLVPRDPQRNTTEGDTADATKTQEYMARLEKVAKEVSLKQANALAETGDSAQGTVFFDDLESQPQGVTVIDKQRLGDRWFKLEVLQHFPDDKELRVKLTAYTRIAGANSSGEASWTVSDTIFSMGYFDFPMIDNTRLSDGKRAAVVLRDWSENRSAEIQLVYFPGSRASLKEKQYYDELLKDLLSLGKTARRPPSAPAEAN